ncbi:MAG: cytidylate kinase-like family protein [Cellulosilyticum sp.]|nr:cytidylate kinase-like family protein [Cellulosilyticum sp.]
MKNFVITIARGYGSGGRMIGQMLANELNINFYDRELLKLASDESGINESLFAKADETTSNSLLYSVAKKVYRGQIIPPDRDDFISNENLFNYQAKIIKELAQKESCVIVGRCADFILKDLDNVLRIFVHAPLTDCIQTVEDLGLCPKRQAKNYIQTIDKRRAAYYHYFTGRDWRDADNYDLCLNTSHLNRDQCMELVKAYLNIKFGDTN